MRTALTVGIVWFVLAVLLALFLAPVMRGVSARQASQHGALSEPSPREGPARRHDPARGSVGRSTPTARGRARPVSTGIEGCPGEAAAPGLGAGRRDRAAMGPAPAPPGPRG